MNYRHIYHAGNFADVVKHAVLSRVIEYLKKKDGAFRILDTHGGRGQYDLSSEEAQRTGEWRDGIGRVLSAKIPAPAAKLLAPYLEAVRALNPDEEIMHYPGSPLITRHMLRKQDRLTAVELHPEDAKALSEEFGGDFQTRVIELDGWLALGAQLPPKEKRGAVLIDPPFEEKGEFDRMMTGLQRAYGRWPGGVYLLWYPIKDRRAVNAFRTALKECGIPKVTDIVFETRPASSEPTLDGCGIVAVNLPYGVDREISTIFSALKPILGHDGTGRFMINVIAGEETAA